MKYICSCGNISKISFSNFKRGHRCRLCGGNEKHTLEDVKQLFKESGCILLEEEYINAHALMKYICSCGNESKISFGHFRQGARCRKCSGCEKLTLKYIEQYFLDNNCKLLEKEYINAHILMRYICNCGNISEITYANFSQGYRCKKCAVERRCGQNNCNWNANLTYEEREANKSRLSDPIYKKWRKEIFIKDDYTCQKCFQKGGSINAHHIINYSICSELRLDKDNGITMCKSCHNEFHNKYGKKNNTRQQLENFLGIVLSYN